MKAKSPFDKPKKSISSKPSQDSFFELVFVVVRKIPKGKVTSYGAIAEFLGTRLSARMVGWAMNTAHRVHPPVPAHRVLNRNGMLTGKHHFQHPDLMQELLENEGHTIFNDQLQNFEKVFWQPK